MKVKIKSKHNDPLRLIDWGITVNPNETVEVEATDWQIQNIKNTPNLELVEDKPIKAESKNKRGE